MLPTTYYNKIYMISLKQKKKNTDNLETVETLTCKIFFLSLYESLPIVKLSFTSLLPKNLQYNYIAHNRYSRILFLITHPLCLSNSTKFATSNEYSIMRIFPFLRSSVSLFHIKWWNSKFRAQESTILQFDKRSPICHARKK